MNNSSWKCNRLGEIGKFLRGGNFLKSDFEEEGFPCVHYGQIHTVFDYTTEHHLTCISAEKAKKCKTASYGDILIAITSEDVECSCKCTAWLGNYEVAVGAHAAIYKHTQNPAFLSYYFHGSQFQLDKTKYTHGSKVVEIKPDDIAKILIKYPALEIQEEIVKELDTIQNIIKLKREQVKDLDLLEDSLFFETFGDIENNEKNWKTCKLGDLVVEKKEIKRAVKCIQQNDTIRYIDISSINNQSLLVESPTCMLFAKAPSRAQQIVNYRDVLISLVRPNLRNIAIITLDEANLVASSGFCVLRAQRDITDCFLFFIVKSQFMTDYLCSRTQGANYPAVREEDIRNFITVLPPIEIQNKFSEHIRLIEEQKERIKLSISDCESLFESRMQQYFG